MGSSPSFRRKSPSPSSFPLAQSMEISSTLVFTGTIAKSGNAQPNVSISEATFNYPSGIAIYPINTATRDYLIIVSDSYNGVVRAIDPLSGNVSVISNVLKEASDLSGSETNVFFQPGFIVYDEFDPSVIVCDPLSNMIRRIRIRVNPENCKVEEFNVENLICEGVKYIDYDGREMEFEPLGYIREPKSVCIDPASRDLFISDSENHCIRRFNLKKNTIKMFAGVRNGPGYNDGDAASARFNNPNGLLIVNEKLWVCDYNNHCIRAIDLKSRIVTILSGSLEQINNNGNFENGESFKNLTWNGPRALFRDRFGRIVVVDSKNAFIRFVLLNLEEEEKDSLTYTIGGGMNDEELRKSFGRQRSIPSADFLNYPNSVAFDPWNNCLITDQANHRIIMKLFAYQKYELAISIFMSSIKPSSRLYPYFHHPLFDTNVIRRIFEYVSEKRPAK